MARMNHAYRRFVFFPDNAVLFDDEVDGALIPEPSRASARAALAGGAGPFRAGVNLSDGPIELTWTAAEGCALSSVYCEGRIILSTILLSGRNPVADGEVLEMYLTSIRRALPVIELTHGIPKPFARLSATSQRPLYGAMLTPMVSRDRCDKILLWHGACAAEYFWPSL
jgi:hypothetical protein